MKKISLFILVIIMAARIMAQQENIFIEKTVSKTVKFGFLLHLPKNYDAKNKYPLVLFLHGAGERGNDLEKVKIHGIPKLIDKGTDFPFIAVSPQCPENMCWNDLLEDLNVLLDDIIAKYSVDTSRVYCTGMSMGGFGTWAMAIRYPNRFAAIAPVCGGGLVFMLEKIKKLPVWAFHGDKDKVVPIFYQQVMIDKMKEFGGEVKFTVYEGVTHNSWDKAYNTKELYDWLLEKKK